MRGSISNSSIRTTNSTYAPRGGESVGLTQVSRACFCTFYEFYLISSHSHLVNWRDALSLYWMSTFSTRKPVVLRFVPRPFALFYGTDPQKIWELGSCEKSRAADMRLMVEASELCTTPTHILIPIPTLILIPIPTHSIILIQRFLGCLSRSSTFKFGVCAC